MSIASVITRLQIAKSDIANAITAKGGAVASGDGFEDFNTDIDSIPIGSSETEAVHSWDVYLPTDVSGFGPYAYIVEEDEWLKSNTGAYLFLYYTDVLNSGISDGVIFIYRKNSKTAGSTVMYETASKGLAFMTNGTFIDVSSNGNVRINAQKTAPYKAGNYKLIAWT